MLFFLPVILRGLIAALLYLINTLLWPFVLYLGFIFSFIPIKKWRKACHWLMHQVPVWWTEFNNGIRWLTTKTEWELHGIENLKHDDWYLLIANHQSWADILILQKIFNRKIPVLKFFMKKQLLWSLPFAGWACWLLDFPFMERYSKEFLAKHPHLKGKDLETTRHACKKFKDVPTSVITFVEGTRFTPEKQARQQSPYKHLLRPRAGGVAYTMSAMGEYFHKILDITIIYTDSKSSLWNFVNGSLRKIIVYVDVLPVTEDLLGDYETDRNYRANFQNWLNQLWQQKDTLIEKHLVPGNQQEADVLLEEH